MKLKLCSVVLALLFLTACQTTTRVEYQPVVIEPPVAFYECADLPEMPTGDYTQRDVANVVVSLYEVGIDCKQALNNIKSFVESQKKLVETK